MEEKQSNHQIYDFPEKFIKLVYKVIGGEEIIGDIDSLNYDHIFFLGY